MEAPCCATGVAEAARKCLEGAAELWTAWEPQAGAVSGPRRSDSRWQQAPLSQGHVPWTQRMLIVAGDEDSSCALPGGDPGGADWPFL